MYHSLYSMVSFQKENKKKINFIMVFSHHLKKKLSCQLDVVNLRKTHFLEFS